jgi:hypothetical protein
MGRMLAMDNPASTDEAPPPAIPPALKAYLDLDFLTGGTIAKNLMDRAEDEAAKDPIGLTDIVGQVPANLTEEMENWYQACVSPDRGAALHAICQLYQEQSEQGKADGFLLPLRQGTLDENLLKDKLKFYHDHNERFHTQSEEIQETQKKAELGRDAFVTNQTLYLGVMVFVIFGSEAAINLESFEALPWATPAIAWGATILIGIAIGLAAHYHGTVYKQYGYYFGPAEDDTKRGPAWRMFIGGSTALSVALAFIYYARSAYLAAYMSSVGDFGQGSESHNFIWVVGGSLLGNILVYLVGTLWAYMMHDQDPQFPEQKIVVEKLGNKLALLKGSMESARARGLEQMNAAHKKALETARRVNFAISAQPRYRKAQEQFACLTRQDDAVIALLLSYRTKLAQRAASLGRKTRYVAYTDDPFARQQNMTAADYQRVALKLKYLES